MRTTRFAHAGRSRHEDLEDSPEACPSADAGQGTFGRYLAEQLWFCRHCRECGEPAVFHADICPHCGAAGPVKVPASLVAMAVGAVLVVGLGLYWAL